MRVFFKTYDNKPYTFDPISCLINRASFGDIETTSWELREIFREMSIPDKKDVANRISSKQHMLQINVTEDCSNRCYYCVYSGAYTFERKHTNRLIEIETAKKAIRNFFHNSQDTESPCISFYGGEPLMNGAYETIKEIIIYAKDNLRENKDPRKVSFSITSNGQHMDDDRIEFLLTNDVILHISLDGPQAIHDRYRRSKKGEPTFVKVLAGLERLKKQSIEYYKKVGFVCVLSPPLYHTKVRDFFNNEPLVKGHGLAISFLNTLDQKLPFVFDENQFRADIAKMYRDCISKYYVHITSGSEDSLTFETGLLGKNLSLLHSIQKIKRTATIGPNGICIPGERKCFLNTDGSLHLCEKVGLFHPIGDVFVWVDPEKSYDLISDYYKLSFEDCLRCWCGNLCDLCFTSVFKGDSIDRSRKRGACFERRQFFKAMIRLYASIKEKVSEETLDTILPVMEGGVAPTIVHEIVRYN